MKLKKVMIVIEENGKEDGKGFNVYMEGDTERLGTVPPDLLSPAEFWGSRLFAIVADVLKTTGALQTVRPRGNNEKN